QCKRCFVQHCSFWMSSTRISRHGARLDQYVYPSITSRSAKLTTLTKDFSHSHLSLQQMKSVSKLLKQIHEYDPTKVQKVRKFKRINRILKSMFLLRIAFKQLCSVV